MGLNPVAVARVESALWDDWHVVAETAQLAGRGRVCTRLLGVPVTIVSVAGRLVASSAAGPVAVDTRYGFVWVCLGAPAGDVVTFAECGDPDRFIVTAGPVGVSVSGLRAVENFLDLGHLAFVHAGILGEEPRTEIASYQVGRRPDGGVIATGCKVYQPLASPVATEGFDVDYVYEVIRPYTVLLYKANPIEPSRADMIVLFVQPVSEESCIAHMLLVYLKHGIDDAGLRGFAQLIFSQDKPILENQLPKRLPLAPHAEVLVRADASSAAYRQWLRESGIVYGAIPAHRERRPA